MVPLSLVVCIRLTLLVDRGPYQIEGRIQSQIVGRIQSPIVEKTQGQIVGKNTEPLEQHSIGASVEISEVKNSLLQYRKLTRNDVINDHRKEVAISHFYLIS